MSFPARSSDDPIDYWREAARRGVMALGFTRFDQAGGQVGIRAELIAPQEGWTRRSAHAAIEVHKLIALEPATAAFAAREALARELGRGPAIRALAIYQGLLLERLWREIATAPAATLEALAYPHEDGPAD